MNANFSPATRGIAGLQLTREELGLPVLRKIVAALEDELALQRVQNDTPCDIKDTTLLRGQIACVKRILARTSEVGPESRQSERQAPESASVASAAGGIPPGFITP